MMIFYWLCFSLTELKPFFDKFADLLSYVISDYFPKVYTSLVEATSSPLAGMLNAALQSLPELFNKPDLISVLNIRLLLTFNTSQGVALIYREQIDFTENVKD